MIITKIGHCCLVLEEAGVKIMTDPGSFTAGEQEKVTGLDAIIITHEHQDHFHVESVQALLAGNLGAIVITNATVGKLLAERGIAHVQVGDGESTEVKGVLIEGFGTEHAPVYETMGRVENTGYMIAEKFYFPGDNFHVPRKKVDILALPVAGPWMKTGEAVGFAKKIQARIAFGVHDAIIQPFFRGHVGTVLSRFVPEMVYVSLADGETREF
mgnify:FL=1